MNFLTKMSIAQKVISHSHYWYSLDSKFIWGLHVYWFEERRTA